MSEQQRKSGGPIAWLRALKWEGMTARDRRNERRTNTLAFVWIGALIAVGTVVQADWVSGPLAWVLGVLPVVPGYFFVRSYLKLLREADEMLRHIQFEALAVGFGAGLICGMTALYLLPTEAKAQIGGMATLMPMVIGYTLRVILAAKENSQ